MTWALGELAQVLDINLWAQSSTLILGIRLTPPNLLTYHNTLDVYNHDSSKKHMINVLPCLLLHIMRPHVPQLLSIESVGDANSCMWISDIMHISSHREKGNQYCI